MNRRQALTLSASALAAAALPAVAAADSPTLAVYDPALEVSVRFAQAWRARGATLASVEDDLVRLVRALPANARLTGLTRHGPWLIADGEMRDLGRRLTYAGSACGALCAWESV